MKSEDLLSILDFLYCGETNVYQEDLDSFLGIAEELQLKGLKGKTNQEEGAIPTKPSEVHVAKNAALKDETGMTKRAALSSPRGLSRDSQVGTVAVANEQSANIQELDEQTNSLMTKTSRKNIRGKPIYVCNVCGKEAEHSDMKKHIEANHLEGISVPCNFCEKMFRSRNAKSIHVSRHHKGQKELV